MMAFSRGLVVGKLRRLSSFKLQEACATSGIHRLPPIGCNSLRSSSSMASRLHEFHRKARDYTGKKLRQSEIQDLCSLSKAIPLEELGYHEGLVQDPWLVLSELPDNPASLRRHPMLR
ncbi:hypothetical protein DUNSADRAFT_8134 [Dunaliella salina]|uniref:Uncharacterized protein n=1 Tax=Dunaliella salina TaxID=3046 RepID=A0ABQ7FTH8_DUNSA|nr:hypothetical protein DUNSADRAFT_8134 [Dunaliella salina]|eukprot:KAF5825610.1 hypothetical protein DUNSADRAFT_8134 [Dunaliella salina]